MNRMNLFLILIFTFIVVEAKDIQLNNILSDLPLEGKLTNKGQVDTYTFIVKTSGLYSFYSTYTKDRTDVKSELLNNEGKVLVRDNDSNSFQNFHYQYYLFSGEEYKIKISLDYRTPIGSYNLHVISNTNPNIILVNWSKKSIHLDVNKTIIRTIKPIKSGTFTFYSISSLDTIGTLYDNNHNELISNDDANSTEYNFKLSYVLESNKVYTLEVENFDSSRTGWLTLNFIYGTTFVSSRDKEEDFNGDGIADILWRNGSQNHVWLMDKNTSHTYINIGGKASRYKVIGRGDFNADGISDILWRKGYENYIWYMESNGSHTYKKIASKSYTPKAIADFNNDGISDILWRKGVSTHIWYMHADGNHTYTTIGAKSEEYDIKGTGDFNGDGVEDILWRKGYKNYIWYMNEDGTHTYKRINSKPYYSVRGIGDFNGDGIDDIIWDYGSIWYMNKDGSHILAYLNSGSQIKVADFNGDGISDFVYGSSSKYISYGSVEIERYNYQYNHIGYKPYSYKPY